ncbi:HNH endonuclease signature motif containing protein [Agromyces humatus]|nr:HNH endonuclease signature motif containing protein [Agromyces humatus]
MPPGHRAPGGGPKRAAEAALDAELEAIVELERSIRAAQAEQLRRIERAHGWAHAVERVHEGSSSTDRELATRAFVAELATALRVHERHSGAMVADATQLRSLPSTLDALARGAIGLAHTRTIIDATQGMPQPLLAEFEVTALDRAARLTNASLRRSLRGLRERLLAEPLEQRQARSALDRRVCLEPEPDGMAWLSLYLQGERATAIRARLDALAGASVDDRTAAQRALDIAADLLLGNPVAHDGSERGGDSCGEGPGASNGSSGDSAARRRPLGAVIPRVYVTVPVMTLLGHSDEPAELDGYGPIDAETARELAAHAPSFQRILTHPETGAYLSYGRESYRVPADLAGYLRVRDGGCRFPGCGRRAVASDIDHTTDWAFDGRTEHENLAHLCRKHHRLKHRTGWRIAHEPGGVIRWKSPAGRIYRSRPEHPFAPARSSVDPDASPGTASPPDAPPEPDRPASRPPASDSLGSNPAVNEEPGWEEPPWAVGF